MHSTSGNAQYLSPILPLIWYQMCVDTLQVQGRTPALLEELRVVLAEFSLPAPPSLSVATNSTPNIVDRTQERETESDEDDIGEPI